MKNNCQKERNNITGEICTQEKEGTKERFENVERGMKEAIRGCFSKQNGRVTRIKKYVERRSSKKK